MSQVTSEQLAQVIATYAKETPTGEVTTVPLDPMCTTYSFGRYWVKVLKAEPKAREHCQLHREFIALDWLVRQNRATLDYKLHVPVPIPIKVDASGNVIAMPCLIMRSVAGQPLLRAYQGGGSLTPEEQAVFGEQIGRYLARLQAINAKGVGLIGVERTGVHPGPWQKYYPAMVDSQWKRMLGSGVLPDAEIEALKAIWDGQRSLLIGETSNLNHNDFQLANLFITREDKKIAGIVNFQNAGVGVPMIDLVSLYVHGADMGLWKEVLKGYENVRSLPNKFEEHLHYYGMPFALYAAFIMHSRKDEAGKGYYLRRAFESASHFDKSYAARQAAYAQFAQPRIG